MRVFTFRIYRYLMKQYDERFVDLCKEYKVTQSEIDILLFFYNNPHYKYAWELTEVRGISKAQVSVSVDKLVKKGYIKREVDPNNRRCNILLLTEGSKEIVSKGLEIQKLFNDQMEKDINEEDFLTFNKVLGKMYENMGGKVYEREIRE